MKRPRTDMDSQLISGHYSIPRPRPFAGVPGPFGRADAAQPETKTEDGPACIADAAGGDEARVPYETSLIHDAFDAPPPRSLRPSRHARAFAFAAGTVALVASLPCIEKRLEPAMVPTSSALAPAVRPAQPVHAAPAMLSAPAGEQYAKATAPQSPHAEHRAAKPSRRAAHAVERSKTSHKSEHPAAHEARGEHARASRWSVSQLPDAAPLPPPSRSDSAVQPPQWAPRTQTRLIGG